MDAGERPTWQQPGFEDGLEAVAVELITAAVQDVFVALDPAALVAAARPGLSGDDQRVVAALIDNAVVELVVDFGSLR